MFEAQIDLEREKALAEIMLMREKALAEIEAKKEIEGMKLGVEVACSMNEHMEKKDGMQERQES